MSEQDIIVILAKYVDNRIYPFQFPNAFIYKWECDYWAVSKNGETREFEIKISRSDFLIDSKKEKHYSHNIGANFFYYVCPEGLISKDEIDKKYGLIYIKGHGYAEIIKKPRRLNSNIFTDWKLIAFKAYWKWYNIWWDKRKNNEITSEEFRAGFNFELEKYESE